MDGFALPPRGRVLVAGFARACGANAFAAWCELTAESLARRVRAQQRAARAPWGADRTRDSTRVECFLWWCQGVCVRPRPRRVPVRRPCPCRTCACSVFVFHSRYVMDMCGLPVFLISVSRDCPLFDLCGVSEFHQLPVGLGPQRGARVRLSVARVYRPGPGRA